MGGGDEQTSRAKLAYVKWEAVYAKARLSSSMITDFCCKIAAGEAKFFIQIKGVGGGVEGW